MSLFKERRPITLPGSLLILGILLIGAIVIKISNALSDLSFQRSARQTERFTEDAKKAVVEWCEDNDIELAGEFVPTSLSACMEINRWLDPDFEKMAEGLNFNNGILAMADRDHEFKRWLLKENKSELKELKDSLSEEALQRKSELETINDALEKFCHGGMDSTVKRGAIELENRKFEEGMNLLRNGRGWLLDGTVTGVDSTMMSMSFALNEDMSVVVPIGAVLLEDGLGELPLYGMPEEIVQ